MRAFAVWGVCPDTGPACFSGRTAPNCGCTSARPASQGRFARSSSRQNRFFPDDQQQSYQSGAAQVVRAGSADWNASFDWEGDAPSFDWEGVGEGPSANAKQGPNDQSQTWDKTFFAPVEQTHKTPPLKINQDLLLFRARRARSAAWRSNSNKLKRGYEEESESTLRRVLAMDPTEARAYVGLGKLLLRQNRIQEARKVYDDGAAVTGGMNEYIWAAWAYMEAKLGNLNQARKLYDAALVANKEHAAAWHGWGLLEKREGNFKKARDIWMKGIKATRDNPNSYLYQALAVMATELQYTKEARDWYIEGTKMVRGAQSNAIWHAWAGMEAKQGDRTLVRYLYKRGLEANPRSRFVYLAWALFEKAEGSLDNARALLKQGHRLNPRDPAIVQAWALLEDEAGDSDKARKLLEEGTQMDPWHLAVWQAWGMLEMRAGNIDEARRLFQQGVWANPTDKDVTKVFQAWAVLESRHGTTQLARELFKCAVKADPTSETSWESWAAFEESKGLLQRAADLRSYNFQRQTSVIRPQLEFPTQPEDPIFTSVLKQIGEWFKNFDEGRAKALSRPPASGFKTSAELLSDAPGESWDIQQTHYPPVLDLEEAKRFHDKPIELPMIAPKGKPVEEGLDWDLEEKPSSK